MRDAVLGHELRRAVKRFACRHRERLRGSCLQRGRLRAAGGGRDDVEVGDDCDRLAAVTIDDRDGVDPVLAS